MSAHWQTVLGQLSLLISWLFATPVLGGQVDPALQALKESLRSVSLREACDKHYPGLLGVRMEEAKPAVDLFYDLKAQAVLLCAFKSLNFTVKAYAMEGIFDLARPGDKKLVDELAQRLNAMIGKVNSGGTEMMIPRRRLKELLVNALGKVTATDVKGVNVDSDEDLRRFVRLVNQWQPEKALAPQMEGNP